MHLALPTRKSSNPPPYATRSARYPFLRRSRAQAIILSACAVGAIIFIISRLFGGGDAIPSGSPLVVIVTVVDPERFNKEYMNNIKDNRIEYARKYGYATFFPTPTDYELNGSPNSWAKVPAMRHALTKFPHSTYVWYLDQTALIMNPEMTIEDIMNPKKLDSLMIRDHSVVPPDSVIKTFPHIKSVNIDFAVTQDKEGLAPSSFVIRKGDWSRFFLDTWFDPLYRSYNFQKADAHALEHIVQWHPTILSKLALIPQRTFNSYNKGEAEGAYKDGDFVIRFPGCDEPGRSCTGESEIFSKQWKTVFRER